MPPRELARGTTPLGASFQDSGIAGSTTRGGRRNRADAGMSQPSIAGSEAMEAAGEADFEVVPLAATASTPSTAEAGSPSPTNQQLMVIIERMSRQINDLQVEMERLRLEPSPEPS